jgi:hypothetical protein
MSSSSDRELEMITNKIRELGKVRYHLAIGASETAIPSEYKSETLESLELKMTAALTYREVLQQIQSPIKLRKSGSRDNTATYTDTPSEKCAINDNSMFTVLGTLAIAEADEHTIRLAKYISMVCDGDEFSINGFPTPANDTRAIRLFINSVPNLEINEYSARDTTIPDFVFPRQLLKEQSIQKSEAIQRFLQFGGIDTSTSASIPVYMHPRESEDFLSEQSCTAKPDICGPSGFPTTAEIKAQDSLLPQLLLQCTQRVYAVLHGCQFFHKATSLAITPSRVIIVELRTDFTVGSKRRTYRLEFTEIDPKDAYRTWHLMHYYPGIRAYAHSHMHLLSSAVANHFKGSNMQLFGFTIISWSKPTTVVYEVRVPEWKEKAFRLTDGSPRFVIKLQYCVQAFENERLIMQKLRSIEGRYFVSAGTASSFVQFRGLPIQQLQELNSTSKKLAATSPDDFIPTSGPPGGFIVMLKGYSFGTAREYDDHLAAHQLKKHDASSISKGRELAHGFSKFLFDKLRGARESLSEFHRLGVCHGDVRGANILYFNEFGRFVLIDFDHSCITGSTSVLAPGDRKNLCELMFPNLYLFSKGPTEEHTSVVWTETCDHDMLMGLALSTFDYYLSRVQT